MTRPSTKRLGQSWAREIQNITYNEWLPALLGKNALPGYTGYKASVNPGIATEFSTALFRFGHSMLGDDVRFLNNAGLPEHDDVALSEAFFNPELLAQTGISSILKYLASDPASEIDGTIVNSVRNFLFGPPGAGGFDLASLNIQRGRDHGLEDYNTMRAAYGLKKVTSFSQITSNVDVQQKLQALYGNVNNIDAWVGALAEDHVAGTSTGPLIRAALIDQFTRCAMAIVSGISASLRAPAFSSRFNRPRSPISLSEIRRTRTCKRTCSSIGLQSAEPCSTTRTRMLGATLANPASRASESN